MKIPWHVGVVVCVAALICALALMEITPQRITYEEQIRLAKEGKIKPIKTEIQKYFERLPKTELRETGRVPQSHVELMEMLRRGEEPAHYIEEAA